MGLGCEANTRQKLYHQTLAIRPKLIKLIEKYSQKKGTCGRSWGLHGANTFARRLYAAE